MQKRKPITPYARLLEEFSEFVFAHRYRNKATMIAFKKADSGAFADLQSRVTAARQLGYSVQVTVDTDGGLVFTYVKNVDVPWRFK